MNHLREFHRVPDWFTGEHDLQVVEDGDEIHVVAVPRFSQAIHMVVSAGPKNQWVVKYGPLKTWSLTPSKTKSTAVAKALKKARWYLDAYSVDRGGRFSEKSTGLTT